MTSPAEPASGDATQASQVTKPLRELAALVLLGANAVLLFVALLRLLVPTNEYSTFTGRAGSEFFAFVGWEATLLPLLAVLLATHVRPVLPKARLITQAALGEYAVAALFGALTFLIFLVGALVDGEVLDAFLGLLSRVATLAIFGIAGFVVYKVWRALYYVPKPKPQPGLYGQPQPGWPQQPGTYPGQPGTYPGQPGGFPGPAGYPSAGPAGYPASGQPTGYPPASPGAQPSGYPPAGPPQSAPPFNTAPPHAPQSVPPAGGPQAAPPFGQPPSADPTQAIPRQPIEPGQTGAADSDRTQRFDRDDPNHPR